MGLRPTQGIENHHRGSENTERAILKILRVLRVSGVNDFRLSEAEGACPERSRRVLLTPVSLSFRAGFSPRGICFCEFFRNLFSCPPYGFVIGIPCGH